MTTGISTPIFLKQQQHIQPVRPTNSCIKSTSNRPSISTKDDSRPRMSHHFIQCYRESPRPRSSWPSMKWQNIQAKCLLDFYPMAEANQVHQIWPFTQWHKMNQANNLLNHHLPRHVTLDLPVCGRRWYELVLPLPGVIQ